jgi:hypothetical protein
MRRKKAAWLKASVKPLQISRTCRLAKKYFEQFGLPDLPKIEEESSRGAAAFLRFGRAPGRRGRHVAPRKKEKWETIAGQGIAGSPEDGKAWAERPQKCLKISY